MIYTSRYNAPSIGANISISLYPPKGFKGEHLPLLAPTPELLTKYKQDNNWENYVAEYRKIIVSRMPKIKEWLNSLTKDVTLLCYENSEHCHRHLVQKLIEKQRPELWGGRLDTIKISEQETQQPKSESTPNTQSSKQDKPEGLAPVEILPCVNADDLLFLQSWCEQNKRLMVASASRYAQGRKELHLRNFVSLGKTPTVKPISDAILNKLGDWQRVESIGESLLPNFNQALILFYPKGTRISTHRDAPAYKTGAAQINVKGKATFQISGNQSNENLHEFELVDGTCIKFDNKQPHAIKSVEEDRWTICFFYLKEQFLQKEEIKEEMAPFLSSESYNPYSSRVISDIWTRSEPARDIDLILATVRQNWGNEYNVYSAVQDLTLKERAYLSNKLTDAERETFETIFWK